MRLHIGGYDVTQLTASITITGDIKACARTLDAEIVQSPVDGNIPSIKIETGAQVTFEADGQDFYGIVLASIGLRMHLLLILRRMILAYILGAIR